MRRLLWFGAGVAAGVVGAAWTHTRLRELRGRGAADQASAVVARTAEVAVRVTRDAVAAGRDAMAEADVQIAADLAARDALRRRRRLRPVGTEDLAATAAGARGPGR